MHDTWCCVSLPIALSLLSLLSFQCSPLSLSIFLFLVLVLPSYYCFVQIVLFGFGLRLLVVLPSVRFLSSLLPPLCSALLLLPLLLSSLCCLPLLWCSVLMAWVTAQLERVAVYLSLLLLFPLPFFPFTTFFRFSQHHFLWLHISPSILSLCICLSVSLFLCL